jgi:3,4-dihydroxy 2-butanone 4-phosphate synthase
MVPQNRSRFQTALTVSIEAGQGVSTGVSARDRVTTIQCAIADGAESGDIVSPGHVFPLRAETPVLQRQGHTEGSIELAVMAGFKPAAVLCELTNANGTMAKGQQIANFSTQHDLTVLSIEELVRHRLDELQLSIECGRSEPACVNVQTAGLD